jgi:hypothetical protein
MEAICGKFSEAGERVDLTPAKIGRSKEDRLAKVGERLFTGEWFEDFAVFRVAHGEDDRRRRGAEGGFHAKSLRVHYDVALARRTGFDRQVEKLRKECAGRFAKTDGMGTSQDFREGRFTNELGGVAGEQFPAVSGAVPGEAGFSGTGSAAEQQTAPFPGNRGGVEHDKAAGGEHVTGKRLKHLVKNPLGAAGGDCRYVRESDATGEMAVHTFRRIVVNEDMVAAVLVRGRLRRRGGGTLGYRDDETAAGFVE